MNPDLPPELERIVNKALEKNLDLRYQSAAEMRSDFKRLKRETDSGRSATAVAASLPARRIGRGYVAAAVLVAVATLLAIAFFWPRAPSPPPRVLATTQLTSDNQPKVSVVTDGPRLYFVERINEHAVLSQVSAGGGEISQISTPFVNAFLRDVSPTRSELLVDSYTGEESFLTMEKVRSGLSPCQPDRHAGWGTSWPTLPPGLAMGNNWPTHWVTKSTWPNGMELNRMS